MSILGTSLHADLISVTRLEREESNVTSPFGEFREKSSQRLIYTREKDYLVTEFNFKRSVYKDFQGEAPEKNFLYQAAFRGFNLSNGQEFRGGRIWGGSDLFQPFDGIAWHCPWTPKLSMTTQFGQMAKIDTDDKRSKPSFSDARLQYYFNENFYMAAQGGKNYDESFGSAILGYSSDNLLCLGEVRGTGATDTVHLGMQYFDDQKWDITSDYYLNKHEDSDSGIMRHYLGIEAGQFYFETGFGNQFYFNGPDIPETAFYEGSILWGLPGKDNLSLGFLHETSPASTARTISARAERRISRNTSFTLGVEDTRFEKGDGSIQNLEGSLYRKVDWGYLELRGGVISGGSDSDLQKDISLKVGYNF